MIKHPLEFSTRKALEVQLGEAPGREVSEAIRQLAERIEQLERNKVDKTLVVPVGQPTSQVTSSFPETG